ncbi:MoaD/ThiS family protein [Schauerella aestuarii]|uniref:MoaD/ThiS family protein n=1 Tax=Schauerella aestuarii TaxID=2511204 RepID=UPI002E2A3C24|nr:MoaD/ThiS family protein [Achromobacter aestuarii]
MANGATIDVLYFARIAELTGKRAEAWPVQAGMRGADLLASLTQKYPDLNQATRLKLAVNQTHAQPDVALAAGDEVAVFEPVTGG